MDCIFCKIVAGEIPATLVYKDEFGVAFKDLNPQAPTHILVIPKDHLASLDEAAQIDEHVLTLGNLMRIAARVAREHGLSEGGYRTVVNTGPDAGQTVFHLHIHILGGRPMSWPPG
jgi:histidine triad (HIT) family protein